MPSVTTQSAKKLLDVRAKNAKTVRCCVLQSAESELQFICWKINLRNHITRYTMNLLLYVYLPIEVNVLGKPSIKHCQRHNGPRVLSLNLESCFWLKSIWNYFDWKRSFKLRTQYPGSVVPLAMFNLWGGIPCISSYSGHQVALFKLVANVATIWHYLY